MLTGKCRQSAQESWSCQRGLIRGVLVSVRRTRAFWILGEGSFNPDGEEGRSSRPQCIPLSDGCGKRVKTGCGSKMPLTTGKSYQDVRNGVTPQNGSEQAFQDIMAATFGDAITSDFDDNSERYGGDRMITEPGFGAAMALLHGHYGRTATQPLLKAYWKI